MNPGCNEDFAEKNSNWNFKMKMIQLHGFALPMVQHGIYNTHSTRPTPEIQMDLIKFQIVPILPGRIRVPYFLIIYPSYYPF